MIATWSAKAICVAGDCEMTSTSNPLALASSAASSKKSVAVWNTPVMSGGVQPMTMGSDQRSTAAGASGAAGGWGASGGCVVVAGAAHAPAIRLRIISAPSRTERDLHTLNMNLLLPQ